MKHSFLPQPEMDTQRAACRRLGLEPLGKPPGPRRQGLAPAERGLAQETVQHHLMKLGPATLAPVRQSE
jgi:hypothetical protein